MASHIYYKRYNTMCGIYATITNEGVESTLISGLRHIEYRGYDSAGICVQNNNRYYVSKAIGEINNLDSNISSNTLGGTGIAHTRWATTGKVSIENTHPFISQNGCIALVHNGIIENVDYLKSRLKGTTFSSQTDSEVVAHLLENNRLDTLDFIDTFRLVHGSYAICFMHKDRPNTLYLAKNKCPLYVGMEDNGNMYVASDPICFENKCQYYYSLTDKEYGIVTKNSIAIYDENKSPIIKEKITLSLDSNYTSDNSHITYMEKEIYEIPSILDNVNNIDISPFRKIKDIISNNDIKRINLIACGTAYHSCLVGAKYLKEATLLPTETYISSEYLYDINIIDSNTLYIFVSQSGETADTISCLNLIKEQGIPTICITNAMHSTMASISSIVIYTNAKKEYAVASTKTYVAQIGVFYRLAKYLGDKETTLPIKNLKIDYFDHSKDMIRLINKYKKVFILGRNNDYATALEISLKIRETCYIPCFALSSGELKHGTLALIDEDSLCVIVSTSPSMKEKTTTTINEIQSRSGRVALITNHSISGNIKPIDYTINLLDSTIPEIEAIIPMQLLSNALSLSLGLNPDKPRNLAKSVTVE